MTAFMAAYVEGCDRCQRYWQDHRPTTPILPQEVPEGPWQTIGVDMIVGLLESKGKNAILTVVDHYTKCKAPWGVRLGCEFVHLTDCEMTG